MPAADQPTTGRSIRLTALLALSGCTPNGDVMVPDGVTPDAGQTFADVALAWTQAGALVTCTELRGCPPSGQCTQHAAVGAPNAVEFVLEAGGSLELGFLCSSFYERGGTTPELRFHAVVPVQASAIVAVSYDGSRYEVLGELDATTLELDLARAQLTVARFVRVTDTGVGGIRIDAVEALR